MNAWKVILAALVIFITGVVTGGLLVTNAFRVIQLHSAPAPVANPAAQAANPWQARSRELLRRMDRELTLTTEQHDHIEAIIAASQERTRVLWKPITPQMNKEMQLVRSEIREQLTDDQKMKFDAFPKPHPNQERRHPPTNSIPAGASPAN